MQASLVQIEHARAVVPVYLHAQHKSVYDGRLKERTVKVNMLNRYTKRSARLHVHTSYGLPYRAIATTAYS